MSDEVEKGSMVNGRRSIRMTVSDWASTMQEKSRGCA